MNNQLLFSRSTQDQPGLSQDVHLNILRFLGLKEVFNIGRADKYLYGLIRDNTLWVHLYERDFGPLTIVRDAQKRINAREDAKLQYIAAYLYQQAFKQEKKRVDLAQILYTKLWNLLSLYKNKSWTHYYRGVMELSGKGVPANQKSGYVQLQEGYKEGDYKAALELAKIYLLSSQVMSDDLVAFLIYAYDQGISKASYYLGRYHKVQGNKIEAEKWLMNSLKSGNPLALEHFIELKDKPEQETISLLSRLLADFESPVIQAEIYYQMGRLYYALDNKNDALEVLKQALKKNEENPEVYELLGSIYKDKGNDNLSYNYYMKAAELGDVIAPSLLINTYSESGLPFFKNKYSSSRISDYYQQSTEIAELLLNPNKIWWLQFAAQGDNISCLEFLLSMKREFPQDAVYVNCALGMSFKFGILEGKLEFGEEQAEIYFSEVRKSNPQALQEYLDAGIAEGFICKEVKELEECLREQINMMENDYRLPMRK